MSRDCPNPGTGDRGSRGKN